jgi:hypothetical protein
MIKVYLPNYLWDYVKRAEPGHKCDFLELDETKIPKYTDTLLKHLARKYNMLERVVDHEGDVKRFMIFYRKDKIIPRLEPLNLKDGDELRLDASIGGG